MADPLSIITSIITLLETAKEVYDAVQDATHLPQTFGKIANRIDLATDTLTEVHRKYRGNTDDETKIRGTLRECEVDAKEIQILFQAVCDAASSDRIQRYRGYMSNLVHHRKSKVEGLWRSLLEGIQVLQSYHLFKNLSTVADVTVAIEELRNIDDSPSHYTAATATEHNTTSGHTPSTHHRERQRYVETPPIPSSNIPFRRDTDHVERKGLTDKLNVKFSVPAARVALVGLGGVGKTQLAVEYAHDLRKTSPDTWVLWIHASNIARFDQSLQEASEHVKLRGRHDAEADIHGLMLAWLRDQRKGRWLVVLDNVDDANVLLEPVTGSGAQRKRRIDYFPVCDHGSILITSRSLDEALRLVKRSDVVMVGVMDMTDSLSLLERKLGVQTEEDMSGLARALDFVPLAMTQATSYISQRGKRCSVRQYIDEIQERKWSAPELLTEAQTDHQRDQDAQRPILIAWQISFEHLYRVRQSAAELLSLMSFCDRQAIPEMLLRKGLGDSTSMGRISRDEGTHDFDGGSEFECERADMNMESDDFDKDIATLEGYSFLSVTTDATVFEMHRLVQWATQQWLRSQGQLEEYEKRYIYQLWRAFPLNTFLHRTLTKALLPHVKLAATLQVQDRDILMKWSKVLSYASWYEQDHGNARQSERLAELATEARTRILGPDDLRTIGCARVLARVRVDLRKWEEAEDLMTKIVQVRSRELGDEHPDTLTAMSDLVWLYTRQLQLEKAEQLGRRLLKVQLRVFDEDHLGTLRTKSGVGIVCGFRGKLDEAEAIITETLKAYSRLLGDDHSRTANTEYNFGLVYIFHKKYDEAEVLLAKALDVKSRVLGEEHQETLVNMAELGYVYFRQGR